MTRFHLLLHMAIIALLMVACGTDPTLSPTSAPVVSPEVLDESADIQPTNANTTSDANPVSADVSDPNVVAKVNDHTITRAAFDRAVARYQHQQFEQADSATIREIVLETMIEQSLIEQAAAQQNITVDEAEVQAEYDALVEAAGGGDAWQTWLEDNLYTAEDFRAELRASIINQRMISTITQQLDGDIAHVNARHIVVATEPQASEVLQRLQNGEDFVTLASEFSRDVTTKDQGGDLGWFARGELLEESLENIAFSLDDGAIAGPIPTMLGYHIIQTLEKDSRPLDSDKRAFLTQMAFERWLSALRQSASIERYP